MKINKERNMFRFWSINYLKSLYFKNENNLINVNEEASELKKTTIADNVKDIKHSFHKSLRVFENDLEIFRKISIKTLKSEYYESIGNV